MKPSNYNHQVRLENGTCLLFNFYTLSLLALAPDEASLLENVLNKNVKEDPLYGQECELEHLLIEKGFLIDPAIDELNALKAQKAACSSRSNNLNLTVLPSLNCNFRCTYCYETPNTQTMTPKIQEALAQYVQSRISDNGNLHVTWFGGEPLMQLDIIESLTDRFREVCSSRQASYNAVMISNGYLLTPATAQKLNHLSVKRVQVTVDGPEAVHDERRPTKGNGKTFGQIIENLKQVYGAVTINLRINVDNTNRHRIDELLDFLVAEGLQEKVNPYLGQTFPYTDICSDVAGACLDDAAFSLLGLETDLKMTRLGFNSFRIPKTRNNYCMAETDTAVVVLPDGGIAKCWNDATNPDARVDHLIEGQNDWMRTIEASWSSRNIFELECNTCKLLPICMGGCPYLFRRTGKLQCHDWKYHIDESVSFYYYLQKLRQEGEIVNQFIQLVDLVKMHKQNA